MSTFPAIDYSFEGYGYTVTPDVKRTEYASRNSRQRLMRYQRDDLFTVTLRLDDADLDLLDTFVLTTINNGADTFTGPYFTSDVEYTGTLEIVDGKYEVRYLQNDFWSVSYSFYVKDRDLTEEQNIYESVIEYAGFDGMKAALDALEDCVNNNNL